MKFALISDIHGNATALEAVLNQLTLEGIDEIYNLGDAIAIGPDPEKVLGILVARRIPSLCGNHEQYFLEGTRAFPEMKADEVSHQDWIRDQLGEPYLPIVSEFPLQHIIFAEGRQLNFLHYATYQNERGQDRFLAPRKPQDLETFRDIFGAQAAPGGITCFGHHHEACYLVDPDNQHVYVNPGSLGCHPEALARYAVVTFNESEVAVTLKAVPYQKSQVLDRLFSRAVPERETLVKLFYT